MNNIVSPICNENLMWTMFLKCLKNYIPTFNPILIPPYIKMKKQLNDSLNNLLNKKLYKICSICHSVFINDKFLSKVIKNHSCYLTTDEHIKENKLIDIHSLNCFDDSRFD